MEGGGGTEGSPHLFGLFKQGGSREDRGGETERLSQEQTKITKHLLIDTREQVSCG